MRTTGHRDTLANAGAAAPAAAAAPGSQWNSRGLGGGAGGVGGGAAGGLSLARTNNGEWPLPMGRHADASGVASKQHTTYQSKRTIRTVRRADIRVN